MKNIKFIYLLMLLGFIACEESLDLKLDETYGDEFTWTLPDKAEGVLMNAYANIAATPDTWAGNFLDVATDNAVTNDFGSGLYQLSQGGQTPMTNPIDGWSTAYYQFRNIHLFMENGLGPNIKYDMFDEAADSTRRYRLKGEAFFLRAWWGMDLLQRFGGLTAEGSALGYPILTRNLSDADRDNTNIMTRNTYEECVSQILADCDSAIKYLPLSYTGSDEAIGSAQNGRASAKAAYALKSRAAIFAASPAYRPEGSYAITDDQQQQKWVRSAQLAQQAIADGQLGAYDILTEEHMPGPGLQDKTPDEFLLRRWTNANGMEKRQYPPLFWGQGRTNPSQNLVDAFPMLNGFPISDPRSGYDPQNPYQNRDNRFELTVYYNGKSFSGERELEIFHEDDQPGRDAAGFDYQNTRTGYYLRKWLSTKKDLLYNPSNLNGSNDYHQHALLRRAEVYLNLAEASNEALGPQGIVPGCSQSAYDVIRDIREKAGITSTVYLDEVAAQGKEAFRALILNERRIEFAFENMRYFDLRRWLLPLDEAVRGVRITKTSVGFEFLGADPNGASILVEERKLSDNKYYYSPLPYEEVLKNPNLEQNKGW